MKLNPRLNVSSALIYQKAIALGYQVEEFGDRNLLCLKKGGQCWYVRGSRTSLQSSVGKTIADRKDLTRKILLAAGLPIAIGGLACDINEATKLVKEIGFPVVVKPLAEKHGKGITVGVKKIEELKEAIKRAQIEKSRVIIEREAEGNDFRILVINYKFFCASLRLPAFVTGDAKATISELIDKENKNPLRGEGHQKPLTKISVDDELKRVLKLQKMVLADIPEKGKKINLRKTANLSTGGVAIDVTDKVHPENIVSFEKAAKIADLNVVGIDVITSDIAKPLTKTGGVIIELNASPGLRMHCFPYKGKAHDAAFQILKMLGEV